MSTAALIDQLERIAAGLGADPGVAVQLERPRNAEHGDFATNLAMVLAGRLRRPPRQLAEEIVQRLDLAEAGLAAADVAGPGFINFRLATGVVQARVLDVLRADHEFGRSAAGGGQRVQVEFVSANPTGPLHIGHGRQASLGDAISELLAWTGWSVHREFYYNDAGEQIQRLTRSVWARYQQRLGEAVEFPADGYHGDYIADIADELVATEGDRYRGDGSDAALEAMRRFAVARLRAEQNRDLDGFRVRFDQFYLESSLYTEGRVEETIRRLRETGLVYEHEGALWLRTTEFGDDKDRVMVKRTGQPTYFLPDVAYHVSKWERGFHHVINVQGSDHHGTVPRVRAGLQALGLPKGYPEYVLHQMVLVVRGGQEVKFSKRAGDYVTLRELYDEVGVDVARYFFLMRRAEAQLTFDLDLALDQSDKNPVYKVQYAHARMCSIFRRAGVAPESVGADTDVSLLTDPMEQELVKQLVQFPETVTRAAEARAPHIVCDYLEATAGMVNSWYHAGNPNRNPALAVLAEDAALRQARLGLARAVRVVLRNGLELLGLRAPEQMQREESE
jgi:arginyl-tRNA synthetase